MDTREAERPHVEVDPRFDPTKTDPAASATLPEDSTPAPAKRRAPAAKRVSKKAAAAADPALPTEAPVDPRFRSLDD